jgi:hypothetical protein
MCLPPKPDDTSDSNATNSILGIGALMMLACLSGPLLAGALGSVGAGVLLGAGGVIFALVLCAAVPAVTLAWRRRTARRRQLTELS